MVNLLFLISISNEAEKKKTSKKQFYPELIRVTCKDKNFNKILQISSTNESKALL